MIVVYVYIDSKWQIIDGNRVAVTSFFIEFHSSIYQQTKTFSKTKHLIGLMLTVYRKMLGC